MNIDDRTAMTQPSPSETPELRSTYNCPVCGWNEPHSEHAGDTIRRLLAEQASVRQTVQDLSAVAREITVYAEHADSFVNGNRVVPVSVLKSWAERVRQKVTREGRER